MNSLVVNARCNIVAVANAACWLHEHGGTEALTSLSTIIRSVVELFNERLRTQGLARVSTAEEALKALRALGLEVKQTQRGRVQLIKQLASEAEVMDGFGDDFSDERVAVVTGLSKDELTKAHAEVQRRLAARLERSEVKQEGDEHGL